MLLLLLGGSIFGFCNLTTVAVLAVLEYMAVNGVRKIPAAIYSPRESQAIPPLTLDVGLDPTMVNPALVAVDPETLYK
jgi:hypothetical protein